MKSLITFFVKNYKLTVVISFFVFLYGLMALMRIKSESFPSVNFAMATINTQYPGAAPADVETKITKPIEDEIRTVKGLKDVRSISQAGMSKIFVRVDMDNVNVDEVMNELQKAVDRTSNLPSEIPERPKFQEIDSEEFPAIELAVVGSNHGRQRDLWADRLKDQIEDIRSVSNVRLTGYREREFSVRLDPIKMEKHHIGIEEVLRSVRSRSRNVPAGNLEDPQKRFLVRIEATVDEIQELKDIYIRSNFSGQSVQLKDIAQIEDSMQKEKVLARLNGQEATLLVVTKKAGTDTIELVNQVKDVMKQFEKTLPSGISLSIYNDEGERVKDRIGVLKSNAISGLVLVIFFLLLFMPGRIGLMASVSLPLAVLGTLGPMPALGMNLNAITVLALVIAMGMLVDNSVVISENYVRLRQEGEDSLDAAIKSAYQFWLPITATALTTIAAFLPMLMTKGIMGEFIKLIPIIVSLSLVLSLAESFFLLPMRLHFVGRRMNFDRVDGEVKGDWFSKIADRFEKIVDFAVKNRGKVFIVFSGILFFSFFMLFKANKFILFPAEQTEIYVARFEVGKGQALSNTHKASAKLSQDIQNVLGESVSKLVGRAGISQVAVLDPKSREAEHVGLILIYMTKEASLNLTHTDVLQQLRSIETPYLKEVQFEALINGPPVGEAINATLRSHDVKALDNVVKVLMEKLESTSGILDVAVDEVRGLDEIYVDLDYDKMARLELDVVSVGDAVKTALEGNPVSKLNLLNKKIDLKIELDTPYKQKVPDLSRITVMDKRGNLVPLGSFAKFVAKEGSPEIKRFDFQRAKTITASVDEEKITSFMANQILKKEYNDLRGQYPNVGLVFGGQEESTKESMQSLGDAMTLALVGIFAVMVFIFNSFLRPFIIMTTIPLGLLGFSVAFYLHGRPVSFLALIGVVGLAGIIVNSGIVLISFIDELRAEGQLKLHEILARASKLRLRAVMVTSLTTISGLFPTAYGIGGSDIILIPMTMSMAWGLTSGTLLTLIWIPCAYALLEDMEHKMEKILGKFGKSKNKDKEHRSLPLEGRA